MNKKRRNLILTSYLGFYYRQCIETLNFCNIYILILILLMDVYIIALILLRFTSIFQRRHRTSNYYY